MNRPAVAPARGLEMILAKRGRGRLPGLTPQQAVRAMPSGPSILLTAAAARWLGQCPYFLQQRLGAGQVGQVGQGDVGLADVGDWSQQHRRAHAFDQGVFKG